MAGQFPVRISIVSYLNSKPFIYGLKKTKFNFPVEISEDIPSICAEKLLGGKMEIGISPISALPPSNFSAHMEGISSLISTGKLNFVFFSP